MADIIVCDKCGKKKESNFTRRTYSRNNSGWARIQLNAYLNRGLSVANPALTLDLCKDCSENIFPEDKVGIKEDANTLLMDVFNDWISETVQEILSDQYDGGNY